MVLNLDPLRLALGSLDRALTEPKDEFVRDSVIQRFEYTYELAWKMLARYLGESEGRERVMALHRFDLYRLGAEKGFLADVTAWFGYHRARNETVHTYDEARAEEVYAAARDFARDARALLEELERRRGA
jgi:nucleotidyltransferase substrate binding protein (TIGR01987 family)